MSFSMWLSCCWHLDSMWGKWVVGGCDEWWGVLTVVARIQNDDDWHLLVIIWLQCCCQWCGTWWSVNNQHSKISRGLFGCVLCSPHVLYASSLWNCMQCVSLLADILQLKGPWVILAKWRTNYNRGPDGQFLPTIMVASTTLGTSTPLSTLPSLGPSPSSLTLTLASSNQGDNSRTSTPVYPPPPPSTPLIPYTSLHNIPNAPNHNLQTWQTGRALSHLLEMTMMVSTWGIS